MARELSMRRVLVTGATGLLGNTVVRALMDQGATARVLTRRGSEVRPFADLTIERVEGDVVDAKSVHAAMEGVDGVVHCAAHVRIGWTELELHQRINVEGTRNVALAAHAHGARMIGVSSVNALGVSPRNEVATEENVRWEIVPFPYAVTKRDADRAVLDLVDRGLDASIVYPTLMFGPWDWKPSSGKMLLEVSSADPVVSPAGVTNVCDARDVAAGIVAALVRGKAGRRYILGGHDIAYFDLWTKIARVTGARGPRNRMRPLLATAAGAVGDLWSRWTGVESNVNSAAIRVVNQDHRFSSARAKAELGYTNRSLEATLSDAWQWLVADRAARTTAQASRPIATASDAAQAAMESAATETHVAATAATETRRTDPALGDASPVRPPNWLTTSGAKERAG